MFLSKVVNWLWLGEKEKPGVCNTRGKGRDFYGLGVANFLSEQSQSSSSALSDTKSIWPFPLPRKILVFQRKKRGARVLDPRRKICHKRGTSHEYFDNSIRLSINYIPPKSCTYRILWQMESKQLILRFVSFTCFPYLYMYIPTIIVSIRNESTQKRKCMCFSNGSSVIGWSFSVMIHATEFYQQPTLLLVKNS